MESPSTSTCPCGSGKAFTNCHGKEDVPVTNGSAVVIPDAPPPKLEESKNLVKLDLGAGQNPAAGFEAVDLYAPAARKVDLFKFPWPFDDDSVDELHSSHFVEHIPARELEARDLVDPNPQTLERWLGVDMLFAFFDECWRILKNGSPMKVIVPALKTDRAFQDPTHRRFIPQELFGYLNKACRDSMGLSHYRVRCDFGVNTGHTLPTENTLLHEEVMRRRFFGEWNFIQDWHVALTAIKNTGKA